MPFRKMPLLAACTLQYYKCSCNNKCALSTDFPVSYSFFPVYNCDKRSSININAVDSSGRTAIHYLMKTCDNGTYENEEMLGMLARLGAKLSQRDGWGKTPLDYAMESRSCTMASALQKLTEVAPHEWVRIYSRY